MKILCEVLVVNRFTHTNRTPWSVKSTLALGYKGNSLDSTGNGNDELEIVLFTPKTKNGQRYKVKDNIQTIHTKYVLDGKARIAFKKPAQNLLIKCDPIQLKGFLQTLKLGMEGKDVINLRLNTVTAMIQKSKLQTKMALNRHSDYPIKAFPRYLQSLTINNTQLVKLSYHIWSLRNLTHLDVSSNKLCKLPVELGRLHLSKLVLHDNNLGEMDDWSFLNGSKLRDSLRELDLSANDLSCLPLPVVKCHKLVNLNLNYNNLTHLPFAIRRLRRLRSLYVSENKLKSLPAAIDDLRIEILDVWRNQFEGLNVLDAQRLAFACDADGALTHSPEPLWLQAAQAVAQYELPIDSLPAILIQLIDEAPKCSCGKLCYALDKKNIIERVIQPKFVNIKNLTYSREHMIYSDVVICGNNCSISNQCKNLFSALIN